MSDVQTPVASEAAAPVATVEVAKGVTVTAAMTPTERFNILAKVHGAPVTPRPPPPVFGPTTTTPETLSRVVQLGKQHAAEAALVSAPPPARTAPVVQKSAEQLAEEHSKTYLGKLDDVFRNTPAAQRDAAWYARWNAEKADATGGRKIGETRQQWKDREAGVVTEKPAEAAKPPEPVVPPSPYSPQQWEEGHKSVTSADGWIPLERINKDSTSGYVLPNLIANQQYNKSIFNDLAAAKAAGLSQEVVSSYITAQMKRDGWIK